MEESSTYQAILVEGRTEEAKKVLRLQGDVAFGPPDALTAAVIEQVNDLARHKESVWDQLAGTTSAPFEVGQHGQVALKVIDGSGNELLGVKDLKEAGKEK